MAFCLPGGFRSLVPVDTWQLLVLCKEREERGKIGMLFSSLVFLLYFFPVTVVGYYCLKWNRKLQNIWLLFTSIFFYAWGEPKNVLLMLFSIVLNWGAGMLIGRKGAGSSFKKKVMIVDCICNLGILFVFKYLTFVVETLNGMAGRSMVPAVDIALPIGISFFTFQALSYVVDVYKGKTEVERNILYVGVYIAFFPQLIAGPIIQYSDIAEQIRSRKETVHKFSAGIARFSVGFGKKILLANNLAILADYIFNWSKIGQEAYNVPALLAWLGAIAYTLQIYFDFSAYSDMAIGLGLIFGFKFRENFNYPYIADSINDFWKRWHISLTDWFREYVYFPLGGSRVKNKDTMVKNMFIVWLLTGIWHGAQWTFPIWGMLHFTAQLAERFLDIGKMKGHRVIKHFYTMFIVTIGWVIFRADDLYQAGIFLKNMFAMNRNGVFSATALMLVKEYWLWLLLGILFSTPIARNINRMLAEHKMGKAEHVYNACYPFAVIALVILGICYLSMGAYNPFIYFNF